MKKKGIILLNKDFSADWLPILKAGGFNTVGLHSLYQYGGLKAYLEWWANAETQSLVAEFEKNGFVIEHQLHAVDWLLSRDLFAEHPDWFRVNDKGARVNDWNFCVSNQDALSHVEESAYVLAALLKQKSPRYYIWSDDCLNSICYCEKCKKYSGADQNMLIMHSILRGLKKYDPQAKLSFLAYQDSEEVPTILPQEDMFLEYAPIGRNHNAPMDGDDQANVRARSILNGLLKIFPAESAEILEYFLDVSLFCQWKRENAKALDLNEERVRRDLAYYAGLGVKGVTTFSSFIDKEWREEYGVEDIITYGRLLQEIL